MLMIGVVVVVFLRGNGSGSGHGNSSGSGSCSGSGRCIDSSGGPHFCCFVVVNDVVLVVLFVVLDTDVVGL